MEQLKLGCPYKNFQMIDLYQRIKKYRKLLGLENCKQKTLERFLGIFREDKYHGGELISVYLDYVKDRDPKKERLLLLHNEEDILGMPKLLPLLEYSRLLSASFTEICCQEAAYHELSGTEKKELLLKAHSSVFVPKPFFVKKDSWYLKMEENRILVRIPLLETELRHFYEDYQNYYYLPMEDYAIHKSVAAYVEKAYRQKATAKNCYTKTRGVFFPQPERILSPDFYETEKKTLSFCLYREELLQESALWERYLKALLPYVAGLSKTFS